MDKKEVMAARQRRRAAVKQPAGQLTPHFNIREFHCKDGTRVPKAAEPAVKKLCEDILEPMRAKFGRCQVLSGYRHEQYNRANGGARYSQHIYDFSPSSVAADVRFERGSPREWASAANWLMRRAWGSRMGRRTMGGVGTYTRLGFVHVDSRPYRADWRGSQDG